MRLNQMTTVIFDSDCLLCSHWVRFLLVHEADETLLFASSRKPVGAALAAEHGLTKDQLDLTYVVISKGRALTKSDASLALLDHMRAPWSWLRLLRIVPGFLRDGIYDIVARNRLKWFGEKKDCLVPTPKQKHRFLE